MPVKKTERGWPAHFIGAEDCLFRRNTLLEHGRIKIIVSTIGLYRPQIKPYDGKFKEIGCSRFYETMAFHAQRDGKYWGIAVDRQITFDSPWTLTVIDDNKADNMHETVVCEITRKLARGDKF